MMRLDVTRKPVSAALLSGVLIGSLAVAGCSEQARGDKKDDPALKASMEKSMEIYKSKAPGRKESPPQRPKRPH